VKPGKELLFLALGGSGEIGMNVNLYGCDGKWLMVDLGMTFADPYYPGVDLVFADLEFIEEQRENLLGMVLTHAHEDHIGAVPYFAQELGVPLYATPFTARLVNEKLVEAGIDADIELNVIPNEGAFSLGPFDIRYVPLAHSIAEGNALLIDTPYGRVFHTGDWKLDDEPRIGTPATEEELTAIGDEGVLALVCDSTNVFNPAASGSEGAVRAGLLETVSRQRGRRVVVTTFASNVARLQTLAEVAQATGRQLCVAGRSLDRIIRWRRLRAISRTSPKRSAWTGPWTCRAARSWCWPPAGRANRAPRWRASPPNSTRSAWRKAMSCCFPAGRYRATNWPSAACRTRWWHAACAS
jgi:ribonuclease J